ncbi:Lipase [Escovopsis weberi]|uniref:Lipase n=1 Tax=Escovopsis weberi TaxID=150374 RepID=A0A0N0RTW5_ESCWE|nr:Lipase [Escovopsis weberi]
MKLHRQKVFVEIEGGTASGRVALDSELLPHAIFVPVDDAVLSGSENPRFVFEVIELPETSGEKEVRFALKADFNHAYLGYGVADRRLILQHFRKSPAPNFTFVVRQDKQQQQQQQRRQISREGREVDGEIHVLAIEASDGGVVYDPEWEVKKNVPLRMRFLRRSQALEDIEKTLKEQMLTLGASLGTPPDHQPPTGSPAKFPTLPPPSDYLSIGNVPKTVPPPAVIRIAKLCAIMSQCTYIRDQDFEEELKSKSYAWDDAIRMLWSEKTNKDVIKVMNNINLRADMARKGIAAVAKEMGLKYQPLCKTGNSAWNGPYCGAFYHDGPNPFIVIAFKGSGTVTDFLTDVRCRMMNATKTSPLKGRLHSGFFNGMFDDFPARLSDDKTRIETEVPFRLINLQLERLMSAILAKHDSRDLKVQLWATGHSLGGAYASVLWAGLLADPYPLSRASVRDLFTFGSPRVGNKAFAEHVNAIKGSRVAWRFVNEDDVIPRVPVRPFLRFWNSEPYIHIDAHVKLSPTTVQLGMSEIETPPPTYRSMLTATKAAAVKNASLWLSKSSSGEAAQVILNLPDIEHHSLHDGYWPSLNKH